MARTTDLVWWYWAATAVTLALGLAGVGAGLTAVIALNAVQTLHFIARARSTTAFPVQVRVVYLGLLMLGLLPGLEFLHWLQLAGTTATITTGYCPLARLLALAPPNRSRALDLALLRRVLFSPPSAGSVLDLVNGVAPRPAQNGSRPRSISYSPSRTPRRMASGRPSRSSVSLTRSTIG